MIEAREAERLRRRYGYRFASRPTLLGRLVEDAGLRVRPMNRADPRYGHWVTDCPSCGKDSALWIAPNWRSFSTSCDCWHGDGGPLALFGLLLGGAR